MKPIEEQGYVILALNTPQVDYLDCARTLTKTIKQWNPHASVCLITDKTYANDPLYDHYRVIEMSTAITCTQMTGRYFSKLPTERPSS